MTIIGLIFSSLSALAKGVLEPTPIPDLFTYLASDKLMAPVLVVTMAHWLTSIAKWAFSNERKDRKEIKEAVSHIPQMLEWQKRMERHLEKVPTTSEVELKILRAMTDRDA